MRTVGFATIGQTPRDDLVPYLLEHLAVPVRAIEKGVLDGVDADALRLMDRADGSPHMVTRLRAGGSARIAYDLAVPRMQQAVTELVAEGAETVVILCGADWSAIEATVPVINPGKLFPNVIQALGAGLRVGIIKPSAGQIERTERQYRELGLDVVVAAAFPYDEHAIASIRSATRILREAEAGLIWMTCVGMSEELRETVRAELDVPIVLARSLLARMIAELVS